MKKIKISKETKAQLHLIFKFFLIMISLIGIIYSSFLFWNGHHSIDLGWNFKSVECHFNTTVTDLATDGNYYTPNQMIIHGVKTQIKGFFLGLFSAFVFGFSIVQLLIGTQNKK